MTEPDQLRAAILAELDRAGTAVGLLDGYDLPAELRPNWIASIRAEEDLAGGDRRILSAMLVRVFLGAAYWERRFRALNADALNTSNAA